MPKWITTKTVSIDFGYKFEDHTGTVTGFFSNKRSDTEKFTWWTPYDEVQKQLAEATRNLDRDLFRIVSVTPHTSSFGMYRYDYQAKDNWGYGYGYGLGFSQITGMTIFATKEEDVSEEEYAKRIKRQQLESQLPMLKEKIGKFEISVAEDAKRNTEISEKKGILSGQRFYIAEQEFKQKEEAQVEQAKILAQIAANKEALETAQAALVEAEKEIESLK